MATSSLATYLDIRQPSAAPLQIESVVEPQPTQNAATVLAAINEGAHALDEIRQKSALSTPDVIDALSWLQRAELVTLAEVDKTLQAQLTTTAVAALS